VVLRYGPGSQANTRTGARPPPNRLLSRVVSAGQPTKVSKVGVPQPISRITSATCWVLAWLGSACNEFSLAGQEPEAPASLAVEEFFEQAPLSTVDILWVVDDTASTASARAVLQASLVGFLDALDQAGLAWQVGVISTDLGVERPGILQGQPWILHPGMPEAEATFLQEIGRGGGGNPTGGLGAMVLALSEPLRGTENQGFRRPEAALQVIVISDADDQSESILGDDPAATALDFLAAEAQANQRNAHLSAIVGDAGTGCSGPDGTALPGDRYLAVAEGSGGISGSICATNLLPLIADLETLAQELPSTFTLTASPLPGSLSVDIDGIPTEKWILEEDNQTIRFNIPPPAGASIRARYRVGGP
jgi:hypothetical protein